MEFNNEYVSCIVAFSNDYSSITVSGNIKNPLMYKYMLLLAPNPIDRMTSYSGSGLPFPCADIAFDNTPNNFVIDNSGTFNTVFKYPNSFYGQDGNTKIVSSIFFILDTGNKKETIRFELKDLCVLRTLVDRCAKKKGPEFYAAKDYILPIDTAENVMRAYSIAKIEYDVA